MAIVGYIRVSTSEQNTARQLNGIVLDKIFTDKASGSNAERPKLQAMIDYVRDGDKVYIHSIDRLARNIKDLSAIVEKLNNKGVTVIFVKNNLTFAKDTNNPMNKLMFTMLGAFAEFERELILERQREGIAKAKANGVYTGRKHSVDRQAIIDAVSSGLSFRVTAGKLGVSLSTVQRVMKENKVASA